MGDIDDKMKQAGFTIDFAGSNLGAYHGIFKKLDLKTKELLEAGNADRNNLIIVECNDEYSRIIVTVEATDRFLSHLQELEKFKITPAPNEQQKADIRAKIKNDREDIQDFLDKAVKYHNVTTHDNKPEHFFSPEMLIYANTNRPEGRMMVAQYKEYRKQDGKLSPDEIEDARKIFEESERATSDAALGTLRSHINALGMDETKLAKQYLLDAQTGKPENQLEAVKKRPLDDRDPAVKAALEELRKWKLQMQHVQNPADNKTPDPPPANAAGTSTPGKSPH